MRPFYLALRCCRDTARRHPRIATYGSRSAPCPPSGSRPAEWVGQGAPPTSRSSNQSACHRRKSRTRWTISCSCMVMPSVCGCVAAEEHAVEHGVDRLWERLRCPARAELRSRALRRSPPAPLRRRNFSAIVIGAGPQICPLSGIGGLEVPQVPHAHVFHWIAPDLEVPHAPPVGNFDFAWQSPGFAGVGELGEL